MSKIKSVSSWAAHFSRSHVAGKHASASDSLVAFPWARPRRDFHIWLRCSPNYSPFGSPPPPPPTHTVSNPLWTHATPQLPLFLLIKGDPMLRNFNLSPCDDQNLPAQCLTLSLHLPYKQIQINIIVTANIYELLLLGDMVKSKKGLLIHKFLQLKYSLKKNKIKAWIRPVPFCPGCELVVENDS